MPLYDIQNPKPAERVIYDGFPKSPEHPKQREVVIPAASLDANGKRVPGEKLNVELHESIANEMQQRVKNETAAGRHNTEIIVNAHDEQAPPKDDMRDFPPPRKK